MSQRASAVSDATILDAIDDAGSRAVNGEPDPMTIADECELSRRTLTDRLAGLGAQGKIVRHDSIAVGTNSTFKTAVVVDDEC